MKELIVTIICLWLVGYAGWLLETLGRRGLATLVLLSAFCGFTATTIQHRSPRFEAATNTTQYVAASVPGRYHASLSCPIAKMEFASREDAVAWHREPCPLCVTSESGEPIARTSSPAKTEPESLAHRR